MSRADHFIILMNTLDNGEIPYDKIKRFGASAGKGKK